MSSTKRKCFKDANGSAVHGVVYSVSKPKNSVKAGDRASKFSLPVSPRFVVKRAVPMPQVQTKKVTFKVARAVELEPGLVLPPGLYTGTKTRTRVDSIGGVSWTPSKYKIELSADQLTSSRFQTQLNLVSKNIDVTKFVRQGKLTFR